MHVFFISLFSFLPFIYCFYRPFLPQPFRIETREIRQPLPAPTEPLFQELDGFYGLIGPDINTTQVESLYDLFTGDGMIQGIFCHKGKMTFVKHFVRTEKLLFESIHGRFSKHVWMTPLYVFLNKIGVLPNVLGLANTAFLSLHTYEKLPPTGDRLFALFERDLPYEIYPDQENQRMHTLTKIKIPSLSHFSGHSKYENGKIHTIDYNVLSNQVEYIQFDTQFRPLTRSVIKMNYMPLVHDFGVMDSRILLLDAPFEWTVAPKGDIPVKFHRQKPTHILLYDSFRKVLKRWIHPAPFYIFHYAAVKEVNGNIDIYAPVYDHIDFSSLDISGKYRNIRLKPDGRVVIKKNMALERMNLDFPVTWGEYTILRSIENRKITGFVVCKGLVLLRRIRLPLGRYFCGEPAIIERGGQPYLLGFSYDDAGMGYVSIVGIFVNSYVEESVGHPLTVGFHSIFTPRPL